VKLGPLLLLACVPVFAQCDDPNKIGCDPPHELYVFRTGDASLPDETPKLEPLARLLAEYPRLNATITGFADEAGGDPLCGNVQLSRCRAEAVFGRLVELGARPTQLEAIGAGTIGRNRIDLASRRVTAYLGVHQRGKRLPVQNLVSLSAMARAHDEMERLSEAYDKGPLGFIVLVPDPIMSTLSRRFDLHVAAVQRALEAAGYSLARHSLPWRASQDSQLAQTGRPLPPHRSTAGWLSFRKEGSQPLIVLLVGETPSGGIHADSVRSAILTLALNMQSTDAPDVYLLGPTFSATAPALARELNRWPSSVDFSVISGTASGGSVEDTLKPTNDTSQTRVRHFDTHATKDDVLGREMYSFLLNQLGIRRVALLTEASPYGGGYVDNLIVHRVNRFPMFISEARGLSAAARSTKASSGGGASGQSLALKGTLGLIQLRGTTDQIPMFDPGATPVTSAAELSQTLRSIAAERYDAVGIVGTNIKDKLFLAGEVDRLVPDARIFTFESDVLLAQHEALRSTRGMIVASSHELSSYAQPADSSSNSVVKVTTFASSDMHGVHLAAQDILSRLGASTDLPRGESNTTVIAYVGNSGIVTSHIRPEEESNQNSPKRSNTADNQNSSSDLTAGRDNTVHSGSWPVALLAFATLAIACVHAHNNAGKFVELDRFTATVALGLMLGSVIGLQVSPVRWDEAAHPLRNNWSLVSLGVGAFMVLAIWFRSSVIACAVKTQEYARDKRAVAGVLAGSAVGLLAVVAIVGPDRNLAIRYATLDGGLSPFVPTMLLLGVLVLCNMSGSTTREKLAILGFALLISMFLWLTENKIRTLEEGAWWDYILTLLMTLSFTWMVPVCLSPHALVKTLKDYARARCKHLRDGGTVPPLVQDKVQTDYDAVHQRIYAVACAVALLVFAVWSYPYKPTRPLQVAVSILSLAGIFVCARANLDLENSAAVRDCVDGRKGNSEGPSKGRVIGSVLEAATVPAIALLAALFPPAGDILGMFGNTLFGWLLK